MLTERVSTTLPVGGFLRGVIPPLNPPLRHVIPPADVMKQPAPSMSGDLPASPAPSFAAAFAGRSRSLWLFYLAVVLLALACVSQLNAQTSLAVGDIQVTGVTADANDSFTFVIWKDISAGTVIRFMDQSFTNATTGVIGTENDMSLTFTAGLTAGTVVRVEDTGTTLVNGGTFTGTKTGSLSGISASGDQVFIYQGTAVGSGTSFSGRTLLYGFNIADTNWVTSGADAQNSFLPTAISGIDASIDSGNVDNADYAGVRTGMTVAAYRAAIANIANYTQNDTRFDLATSSFTSTGSVNLTWDNNGTTAGTGGTGTWDTTTQSRFSNSGNTTFLHWVNSSTGNDHTAVFGGTAGTVSVASGGVTASGLTFNVNGYTLQNNTVTLAGSTPTLTVTTAGHTATVTSTLAGSNGLTKNGAGTAILTGANTYSGSTTVANGTLQVDNTTGSGTGTGTVTVQSGAKLQGTGTISGTTTIQSGGVVEGGTSTTTGVLHFTAVTMNDGSRADFHLAANGVNDRLDITGANGFTVGSGSSSTATFKIILDYTGQLGDIFNLLDWTGSIGGDTNLANNLDLSSAVLTSGLGWDTSNFHTNGTISIVAVPEPSRLVLAGLGLGCLLLRRTRSGVRRQQPSRA